MLESGAHGGEGERVAGERAADAADINIFEMEARGDALGDLFSDAVGRAGNAAADGLAEDENIGLKIPLSGAAAGTGANGVGFIGDEKSAIAAGEFACGGPVALGGKDDADVGHGGLGEDASDVVMLESVFEGLQVVELDDASGFGGIDGRADIAAARADNAVVERDKSFVHGAVIAVVENENFGALRDFACDANGEAVGVGGGERELPERKAETALEIFADPERVLGGKHERDAFAHAAGNGFGDDLRRVAGHGAGVAEAEVDVIVAINVGEMGASGGFHEDREGAGPFVHPVHGDAAEKRALGAEIEFGGTRVIGDETFFFALVKGAEARAVDGGHRR